MARPREFDRDATLDRAVGVFAEHGFEGSSAQMLVEAMGIGRQSLYATYGDKWQLYCLAVDRYGTAETAAHVRALKSSLSALDGIKAMLSRVVATARQPCLGVGSIYEFGTSRCELVDIKNRLGQTLHAAVSERVTRAQFEGDVAADLQPNRAAEFIISHIAAIRITARGGAGLGTLNDLAEVALRALR